MSIAEIEDTIGMCVYVGTWAGAHALEVSDYIALTNAVMGLDLTEDEFMHFAAKGRNLEAAFNRLHTDLSRADDYPPKRYMDEPIKSGRFAGRQLEPEGFDKMLDEFYESWGWDKKTGWQTYESLVELEMVDIAEILVRAGKLAAK